VAAEPLGLRQRGEREHLPVNGVNATNPRGAPWGSLVQVNYDTVEQVKVLSLGSQAEYGSFSGAAIDVLTKSGSNDFHGSAAYYDQIGGAGNNATTDFGSDWLWADPEDDLTTTPESNWEANATLGGPILRDKLWFYAGYSHRDAETDTPLWIPLETYQSDLYDIKLTGEFGGSHRLWLGYHFEDNESGNTTWGPTWDPTMYYDSPVENNTWQLEYQWVISDTNLAGFKYLGFDTDQNPTIPALVGHPGYINWWKWIGGRSVGVNGDFPYIEAQKSKRDTFQADFTHYAEDWAGSHEIKFGAQYTTANGDWMGGYFQGYANFAYPYPYNSSYTRETFNAAWWSCDYTWCIAPDDTVPFYNRKTIRNPWLNARESEGLGFFLDDQWVVSDRSPQRRAALRQHDGQLRRASSTSISTARLTPQRSDAVDRGLRGLRLHKLVAAARLRRPDRRRGPCCGPRGALLRASVGPCPPHWTWATSRKMVTGSVRRDDQNATTGSTPTRWCGRPASSTAWSRRT
jgi:hypothetical protein